jgi:O-antigen/teichoic acid export membrane protein
MLKQGAAMMAAHIVQLVLGLASAAVLARVFLPADLGAYLLAISVFTMGSFAALPGMSTALLRGVLKGNERAVGSVMIRSVATSTVVGIVLVGVGSSGAVSGDGRTIWGALFAAGLMLPLSAFDKYDVVLQGRRNFYASRALLVAGAALNAVIVPIVAALTASVASTLVAFAACDALKKAAGWWVVLRTGLTGRDAEFTSELIRQGWQQSAYEAVSPISSQLDRVVLGTIAPSTLAVYHIGAQLPRHVKDNAKAIMSVPIAHWSAMETKSNLAEISRHGGKVMLAGIALSLLVCMAAPWLLPTVFGKQYRDSVPVAMALSATIALRLLGSVYWAVDQMQNVGKAYGKNVVATKVVYIIMLVFLIPRFGIAGAVGSIIVFDVFQFALGYAYFSRERRIHFETRPPART